jgi:hypothetical protein
MKYIIKNKVFKKDSSFKIVKGSSFSFIFSGGEYEVDLYNSVLINKYILKQFEKRYKRLLELFALVTKDDDIDDEEFMITLNEAAKLRGIINKHYQRHINNTLREKMLKKIEIIEYELKQKTNYFTQEKNTLNL